MPAETFTPARQHPPLAALLLAIVVVTVILLVFTADAFLNSVVRGKLEAIPNATGSPVRFLGRFHLDPLTLDLQVDSLILQGEANRVRVTTGTTRVSGVQWYLLALGLGLRARELAIGAPQVAFSAVAGDSTAAPGEDPAAVLPSFLRPLRIERISISKGSFRFGQRSSLESASGVVHGVRLDTLPVTTDDVLRSFTSAAFDLGKMSWREEPRGYRYSFNALSCNTDEEYVRIDSLAIAPALSDTAFFAAERARTSRFIIAVPRISLEGFRFADLREHTTFHARSLRVERPAISVLIDRRKPDDIHGARQMPNELLSQLEDTVQLDSVEIVRGSLTFGELFSYSRQPALLHWSSIDGTLADISNRPSHPGHTTLMRAELSGAFMEESSMRLSLQFPLAQQRFALSCGGSLASMDLTKLNPFLEVSDRTRVTGGRAEKVDFSFRVVDGVASGTTLPLYSGLKIATLSRSKGKSGGVVQTIRSLLANTFVITEANPPEPGARPKQGTITYRRRATDPFFGYLWFALRSGLGEVVGFSVRDEGPSSK